MSKSKLAAEAGRFVTAAVRLTRWLQTMDPAPVLTGAQASALAVIVSAGKITPSRLAQVEEVKRPTIARLLTQLESLGAIKRVVSTEDGRSVTLSATAKGRALIRDGHARRIAPFAAALIRLPPKERHAISRALPVLEALLEREINRF